MILKFYEIKKINLETNKIILFYGKNEGLKNETINKLVGARNSITSYDQNEILDNENNFYNNILSKSLFENEKTIIIKRATEKLNKIIENLNEDKLENVNIIINSDNLEKKSKLRSAFEKNKNYICVAFYPDTLQTLIKLTYDFLREKKISIATEDANLIVNKCSGDRQNLLNELKKLEYFSKKGKKITRENIIKLTNLAENYNASELIDNCLAKNKKKIINILNENNFSNEDCILIIRTFLNKSKKILKLSNEFENNQNIDLTISSARPPIFWKDKEITKQQINKWTSNDLKKLIYKLSEIELLIKKNLNNSINIITDFILDQTSSKTNNEI